jgi:site-specific DNA-methyltransferase (adenine-specific)
MGKDWDSFRHAPWEAGARFSKPGIGERKTAWPSFSATTRFAGTNPTCGKCGGRARGKKKCCCDEPQWKPIGKRRKHKDAPEGKTGDGAVDHMRRFQEFSEAWAMLAFDLLKPGGHLLAFGGTRTYHRMACAVEDTGFEIRDCIQWLYGSGFPKSHDVSKGIDKAAGAEREIVDSRRADDIRGGNLMHRATGGSQGTHEINITAPATEAAKQWDGWGTALKPACEMIVFARKPLSEKTVAANVLEHGTGAINVDGCRVGTADTWNPSTRGPNNSIGTFKTGKRTTEQHPAGRWPANVIHDGSEEVLGAFVRFGSAPSKMGGSDPKTAFWGNAGECQGIRRNDSGTAARFFYTSKADKADRLGSKHPTVKPVDLIAYLCCLITPPGGTILDPFAGSGTTAMACLREGFDCILIEKEAEYIADIQGRLLHVEGKDTPLFSGPAA